MAPPPDLPGVFHAISPVLDHYGYTAVGGFVLLEDFGIPVPGETILIAAAVYAGAGRLNVVVVAAIAFVAAVVGDNIGFAIGHYGGRPLALRWGHYVFVTPRRLDHAGQFFARHGGKVVVISRFVEGLRQVNGIIAGISKMPWLRRFVPYNALGAALWVGVWTTVGYAAGSHLNSLYNQLAGYEIYLGIAAGVLVLVYIGHKVWRRDHPATKGATDSADPTTGNISVLGTSDHKTGHEEDRNP